MALLRALGLAPKKQGESLLVDKVSSSASTPIDIEDVQVQTQVPKLPVSEKKAPEPSRTIEQKTVLEHKTPAQISVTAAEVKAAIDSFKGGGFAESMSRVEKFYATLESKEAALTSRKLLRLCTILNVIQYEKRGGLDSKTLDAIKPLVTKLNPLMRIMQLDPAFEPLTNAVRKGLGLRSLLDALLPRFEIIFKNAQYAEEMANALVVLRNAKKFYLPLQSPRRVVYQFPQQAVRLCKLIVKIQANSSIQAFCEELLNLQQADLTKVKARAIELGATLKPADETAKSAPQPIGHFDSNGEFVQTRSFARLQ